MVAEVPEMPGRKLSVRSKLSLMFAVVCVATFGLGGFLVTESAEREIEREVHARLEFQSRAYAAALDGHLRLLARRAEDFASDGFIRDGAQVLLAGSAPGVRDDLRDHLIENKLPLEPAFLDLELYSPDGERLLSTRAPGPEQSGIPGELVSHETRFSRLLPPLPGSDSPRLAVATPLESRDRDAPLGVLVAWVHPSILIVHSLHSDDLRGLSAHRPATLRLLDGAGGALRVHPELIAPDGPRPGSDLVRDGYGLTLEDEQDAPGPAAREVVSWALFSKSYPIAMSGWSVRVDMSGEDLQAALARLQSRFLGLGVALTLAACVLFLLPMRFLTQPLLQLASVARRLASGDLSARVEVEARDEIGDLGQSFNAMASAIEDRTLRLEHQAEVLRQRQSELAVERDRLQAVITSMRDGLVVLDSDGNVLLRNAAAGPLLEQLRSDSPPITARNHCANSEAEPTACRTCLLSTEVGPCSCVVEMNGGVFEVHSARLDPDADGRVGRVVLSHDVTDRIVQDERQIHQERLAVLGEVAAVVAHELNNPLAAISMFNQMLHTELEGQPELLESVDVIQRNVESCKHTIRDLLDYATDSPPHVDSVDLGAVLEDVSSFLRPLRERSGVEVVLDLDEQALVAAGDEVQIRQIFVNLVVNAIQAMGDRGGRVTIETRRRGATAEAIVRDDGPGIPPDVRERIFRPFFTTKERGEGTGLGLSTAQRIAEMHGGGLALEESSPEGSVFRVWLRTRAEEDAA
jgi:signal transduction histidine kinase